MSDFQFWVESEGEAVQMIEDYKFPFTGTVYVGKRGSKRDVGHRYLHGDYFEFDIDKMKTVSRVKCPQCVVDAVQHTTPDLLITDAGNPVISLEVTFHTPTYNNVAQRLTRVVKAAEAGFDSFLFQKIEGAEAKHISWFTKALDNADSMLSGADCLPVLFNDQSAKEKLELIRNIIEAKISKDENTYRSLTKLIRSENRKYIKPYNPRQIRFVKGTSRPRSWLKVSDNEVKVLIGVKRNCDRFPSINCGINHCQNTSERRKTRDEIKAGTHLARLNKGKVVKCVWITKGTGGMDPYPGLVLMAKLLFCYDSKGRKTKELSVHFKHLPQDFWWLRNNPNEVYYKTLLDIADVVSYR